MTRTRSSAPFWLTLAAAVTLTACGAAKDGAPEQPISAVGQTVGDDDGDLDGRFDFSRDVQGKKEEEKASAVIAEVDEAYPAPEAEPAPLEESEEAWDDYASVDAATTKAPSRSGPRKKDKSSSIAGLSGLSSSTRSGGAVGAGDIAPGYYPPQAPVTGGPIVRPSADPPVPDIPDHLRNSGEDYTDYGVNDFTITSKDRFSTFAADVDTASYAISRSKLQNGYLPATSAVRVEEYVNYFDYEYKQPAKSDPFAVDFEASPSPWDSNNHIVRIGVQGKRLSFEDRKPVHLTFLVDTSGSMQSEKKIGLVKQTLKMLTEELEDGDTVGIATYAGSTQIVLEPTAMSNKKDIIRALDRLTAGGSTAMASGMELAYQLADATYVDGSVNRVIVCSDGDANVGRTTHEQISTQVRGYAEKGITMTTVGFGNGNYKDTMMERLANDGDGNYYYIDSELEARRVFVDQLTSTMEVIAKDVKLQVEWNPEDVIAYRLIGYENRDVADRDFRNDAVDAGEIGAGHQVTALYEVVLADDASGEIATVRVRNKAPGPDAPAVERSFALDATTIRSTFAETSDQYRISYAASQFAEILRGSPHTGEISLRQVQEIAKGAARPEYPADAELVELIGTAARLKGEGVYSSR